MCKQGGGTSTYGLVRIDYSIVMFKGMSERRADRQRFWVQEVGKGLVFFGSARKSTIVEVSASGKKIQGFPHVLYI
jgi:hypothetical protein